MTASELRTLPPPRPLPGFGATALFLDLDGTLAAFEPRPEDVGPQPWRTGLLQTLQERLDGRLAVISGRGSGRGRGAWAFIQRFPANSWVRRG